MENYTPIDSRPIYGPLYRGLLKAEGACRFLAVLFLAIFLGRIIGLWAGLL